jgi:hypothetical protein
MEAAFGTVLIMQERIIAKLRATGALQEKKL